MKSRFDLLAQAHNLFNNQDKFYLWYFARTCAPAPEGIRTEINEDLIPLDDPKGVSPLLPAWVTAIPLP